MPKKLKGKCKYYIEHALCLGCERLAIPTFEGDDNCIYIKEREEFERRGNENFQKRKW